MFRTLASVSLSPTWANSGSVNRQNGNLPAGGRVVSAVEVVMHDTEIATLNVGKLGAACYLADRPNTGCGRLKALIDLHVSTICQFDAGQTPVRYPRCSERGPPQPADECPPAFSPTPFCLIRILTGLARLSRYPLDTCIQNDVDALVLEEAAKRFSHVFRLLDGATGHCVRFTTPCCRIDGIAWDSSIPT